jgi:hypothetical protein
MDAWPASSLMAIAGAPRMARCEQKVCRRTCHSVTRSPASSPAGRTPAAPRARGRARRSSFLAPRRASRRRRRRRRDHVRVEAPTSCERVRLDMRRHRTSSLDDRGGCRPGGLPDGPERGPPGRAERMAPDPRARQILLVRVRVPTRRDRTGRKCWIDSSCRTGRRGRRRWCRPTDL